MRQVFFATEDTLDFTTLTDLYPWFAVIIAVDGGYMIFESRDDAQQWENQQ